MINELEIDSIIHSYNEKIILSDIYIKCLTGDIIGLLGINGSGKSTLLKIIFGTLKAKSKNIRINKQICNNWYKKGNVISYLPQENFLPPDLTVKKIIKLYILKKVEIQNIINDERIKELLNVKTKNLSGGELRYFELLLLINLNTKFILLDEPFAEIEPIYKEIIKEKIVSLKEKIGFIITDHDYRNVIDICTKTLFLGNAKLNEVKDIKKLIELGYLTE
jgi:ABC-type lipopolysaccharide export system ATPase subunit